MHREEHVAALFGILFVVHTPPLSNSSLLPSPVSSLCNVCVLSDVPYHLFSHTEEEHYV
jgi:hypothetical protein